MSSGWFKIHRKLFDHWLWDSKNKSKFEAWLWMINRANHEDNEFLLGNELVTSRRGQFVTSELKLMSIFGWSKSKVRAFTNLLKKELMIDVKKDRRKTVITILNYNTYQKHEKEKEPQKNHKRTTKEPQKDTNKNEKNYKEKIILVIEYLNKICGTKYKTSSQKTKDLIIARINDGFNGADFKIVIDNKHSDWKGTEHEKYLRPETLFGNKFEGYLNQKSESSNYFDNL